MDRLSWPSLRTAPAESTRLQWKSILALDQQVIVQRVASLETLPGERMVRVIGHDEALDHVPAAVEAGDGACNCTRWRIRRRGGR